MRRLFEDWPETLINDNNTAIIVNADFMTPNRNNIHQLASFLILILIVFIVGRYGHIFWELFELVELLLSGGRKNTYIPIVLMLGLVCSCVPILLIIRAKIAKYFRKVVKIEFTRETITITKSKIDNLTVSRNSVYTFQIDETEEYRAAKVNPQKYKPSKLEELYNTMVIRINYGRSRYEIAKIWGRSEAEHLQRTLAYLDDHAIELEPISSVGPTETKKIVDRNPFD